MANQEITQADKLQQIIEYASQKGWNTCKLLFPTSLKVCEEILNNFQENDVIFSHSFLKALFGEELYINYVLGQKRQMPLWKMKAHELVENPEEKRIDYLYNYIKALEWFKK